MTVEKLKNQETIVKDILERSIGARNDDFYLYAILLEENYPELHNVSLIDALTNHKKYNLPSMKSVERNRRKVQEKCPSLASERAMRKKEEQIYKEYANG